MAARAMSAFSFFGRMVLDLEAPKCPAGSNTEDKECNRRPKQEDWNHKEIASGEFALEGVHEQIDSPAHDPSGGYEKPNPKQAAMPIYWSGFARFRSERAAWNAVERHRGSPVDWLVSSLAVVPFYAGDNVTIPA
jgi:hypothetical protein